MPARKALIPLLLVPALLAGCGGGDVAYEEIKSPPPTLTVPEDSGSASTKASSTATPTATPSVTPTAASGTSAGGTTGGTTAGGTTPGGTTAGGTTGTGGAGTQTQTQPQDTGGASPDEGLDQFCADNPGACDGNG